MPEISEQRLKRELETFFNKPPPNSFTASQSLDIDYVRWKNAHWEGSPEEYLHSLCRVLARAERRGVGRFLGEGFIHHPRRIVTWIRLPPAKFESLYVPPFTRCFLETDLTKFNARELDAFVSRHAEQAAFIQTAFTELLSQSVWSSTSATYRCQPFVIDPTVRNEDWGTMAFRPKTPYRDIYPEGDLRPEYEISETTVTSFGEILRLLRIFIRWSEFAAGPAMWAILCTSLKYTYTILFEGCTQHDFRFLFGSVDITYVSQFILHCFGSDVLLRRAISASFNPLDEFVRRPIGKRIWKSRFSEYQNVMPNTLRLKGRAGRYWEDSRRLFGWYPEYNTPTTSPGEGGDLSHDQ
jgi:hypothetical protein